MLPCQVLHIIEGNGPQSWLATQSGFKNNLIGKGREGKGCEYLEAWKRGKEGQLPWDLTWNSSELDTLIWTCIHWCRK